MTDEYLPRQNSIILSPTNDPDIWQLSFTGEQSGEQVQVVLPLKQLRELDAEFTGQVP